MRRGQGKRMQKETASERQRMKAKRKTLSEWKRTHTGTQRAVRE